MGSAPENITDKEFAQFLQASLQPSVSESEYLAKRKTLKHKLQLQWRSTARWFTFPRILWSGIATFVILAMGITLIVLPQLNVPTTGNGNNSSSGATSETTSGTEDIDNALSDLDKNVSVIDGLYADFSAQTTEFNQL